MGIDALHLQAGQGAHRGNGVGRLRPVSLITQPAQTGHTGVRLHVDAQPPPCRLGGGGKGPGTLQIVDRLGQPIAQQLLRAVGWRVAQEQDRGEHPGLPQLPGLRQAGHRQVLRPQLLQLPGHGDRPVAIGVGLHHAQFGVDDRDVGDHQVQRAFLRSHRIRKPHTVAEGFAASVDDFIAVFAQVLFDFNVQVGIAKPDFIADGWTEQVVVFLT